MNNIKIWGVLLAMTLSACTATQPTQTKTNHQSQTNTTQVDSAHNAQNALDWAGTYTGKTPEYSVMVLVLKDNQTYALKTLAKKSNEPKVVQGKFQWESGGSVVKLDNQMRFFIAEGRVQLLPQGVNGYQANSPYTLEQVSNAYAEFE